MAIEIDGQKDTSSFPSGNGGKKGSLHLIFKGVPIAAVFVVVFFLIYKTTKIGKANFVLSNQEITSEDADMVTQYKPGDKIYFFINKNFKKLDASLFIIEIEYNADGEYRHYKQISYEIDKEYPKLSAYMPVEYFQRAGKYRVKASLDGEVAVTNLIEVVQ